MLLETNSGGTTQVVYTQTPDPYGALVSQHRGATSTFYLSDALGATTELTAAESSFPSGEALPPTGPIGGDPGLRAPGPCRNAPNGLCCACGRVADRPSSSYISPYPWPILS